jgi:hypothetical protein
MSGIVIILTLFWAALTGGTGRDETTSPSSTLAVALGFVHIDRQLDGRALFSRNHRPVAFPTPPPLPRLGAEVTTHQKQEDTERGDADEQNHWISHVDHSQISSRYFADSCTFKPDGKSGAARTAELQPVSVTPTTASTAAVKKRVRL